MYDGIGGHSKTTGLQLNNGSLGNKVVEKALYSILCASLKTDEVTRTIKTKFILSTWLWNDNEHAAILHKNAN